MAVFMINICKFNGCGITFPSLGDLIQHIEDTHIDYDPLVIEQKEASQPSCLPLSYVLRFFTEASRRESPITQDVRRKLVSIVKPPSVRSNTPTGSEFDEEEMLSGQSEDSNDSWTNVEEFSSEFILRYGSRINTSAVSSGIQGNGVSEKPFACPVPGCKKRYKNVNGIKYHSKNGHKKDGKVRKGYKCHCGKSYKTAQGLKNHSISQHFTSQPPSPSLSLSPAVSLPPPPLTPHTLKPLSLPVVKALQGLVVASSQNHLSNNGSQSRHVTQSMDSSIDSTKVIRAVLENAGNKLSKEGISSIPSLTLPRHSVTNLQISVPNVITASNGVNLVHHTKLESDPRADGETKMTQSITYKTLSHNINLSENGISQNSTAFGILTPASSPRASPRDDKSPQSINQMRVSHSTLSATIGGHALPLTPLTPSSGDTQKRFTVPNNMVMH